MQERQPRSQPDPIGESVRRIVTRTHADDEQGEDSVNTPTNVEKLLLTPALRVADGDPAPEIPEGRRPRVTTRTLSAERVTLEQRIAELERAVTPDGNWEPDGSEGTEQETPKAFPGLNGARTKPDRPTAPVIQAQIGTIPLSDLQADEGVAAQNEDPDVVDQARQPSNGPDVEELDVDATDPTREVEPVEPAPVWINDEADEAEAAAEAAAEAQANELAIGGGIDDVALREMVAEIVRSELQGELGERITRNVRKLVRREIYRAIMTRDIN
ncbi:MAG: hypothetical protein AAGA87_04090 [Pseudomonadota bacterium]